MLIIYSFVIMLAISSLKHWKCYGLCLAVIVKAGQSSTTWPVIIGNLSSASSRVAWPVITVACHHSGLNRPVICQQNLFVTPVLIPCYMYVSRVRERSCWLLNIEHWTNSLLYSKFMLPTRALGWIHKVALLVASCPHTKAQKLWLE